MPKHVDFKGVGLIEFPDDFTDEQIASTLKENEDAIQKGVIESERQRFEAETLAAPENRPTAFERIAAVPASFVQGNLANVTGPLRAVQDVYEGARGVAPKLTELLTPSTWRDQPSPNTVAEKVEGLTTVDPTTETGGVQGYLVNPVARGLGQVTGALATGGAGRAAQLGRAGARAVAIGTGIAQEFDDAYQNELQRQKDEGEDENKAKAAGKAGVYGALVAYVENKLGIGRIIDKFGKVGAEKGKQLAKKTASDLIAGFSEESIERIGQDLIVHGEPNWEGALQEGIIGSIVQGGVGVAANAGNRRVPGFGSRQGVKPPPIPGTETAQEPEPEAEEPGPEGPAPEPDLPGEAGQILKVLTATEQDALGNELNSSATLEDLSKVNARLKEIADQNPIFTRDEQGKSIQRELSAEENSLMKKKVEMERKLSGERRILDQTDRRGLERKIEDHPNARKGDLKLLQDLKEWHQDLRKDLNSATDETGKRRAELELIDVEQQLQSLLEQLDKRKEPNAVQVEEPGESVPRQEGSELGLPPVEQGNEQPRDVTGTVTQGEAPTDVGETVRPPVKRSPELLKKQGKVISENLTLDVRGIDANARVEFDALDEKSGEFQLTIKVPGSSIITDGITFGVPFDATPAQMQAKMLQKVDEFMANPPDRSPEAIQRQIEEAQRKVDEAAGKVKPETIEEIRAQMRNRPINVARAPAAAAPPATPVVPQQKTVTWESDEGDHRRRQAGVTHPAKPGMLTVTFRDLQSYPVGEATFPATGNHEADLEVVKKAIREASNARTIVSLRESSGILADADGKATVHFFPSSKSPILSPSELAAIRSGNKKPPANPVEAPPAPAASPATEPRPHNLPPHRQTPPARLVKLLDMMGVIFNGGMDAPNGKGIWTVEVFDPEKDPTGQRTAGVNFKKDASAAEIKAKIRKVREARKWKAPPKDRRPFRARGTDRPTDVLDAVKDLLGSTGKLSLQEAKRLDPNFKDRPKWFKLLFRNGGTELAKMGSEVAEVHGIPEVEDNGEALYYELLGVRERRRADREKKSQENSQLAVEAKLLAGDRAPGEPPAGEPVAVGDLEQDTILSFGGKPMKVVYVNPETGDTVIQGEVLGRFEFSEKTLLYPDKDSIIPPGEPGPEQDNPFDRRGPAKRQFSKPLWTLTDEELDEVIRNPPRGTVGSMVAPKTYSFANYDEFKKWMDERYAARDLIGMQLGYASVDAAFKKQYIKDTRNEEHKRSWIAHLATGAPLPTEDPPVDVTSRPDPPSMGGRTERGKPARPSEPPPPPREPSDLAAFDIEALVQLLKVFGKYPRINKLMRAAYGRFKSGEANVELKQRLFWDQTLARRVLSHEIGHFIDLAIEAVGKGKSFGQRWQPLRDFKKKIGESKALREAAKSLSRAWRGPFANGDPYRDTAPELFADVMSALLTKPELVNQNWPLLHDTFQGLIDGKPAFKAAYDDLTNFLKAGNIGELGSKQRREGYAQSIKEFSEEEHPEKAGLLSALKQAIVSRWSPVSRISGKETNIGNRMVDKLEHNDLLAVRMRTFMANQFKIRVQPLIDKIRGGGENGRFDFGEYLEAGRVINERTASGKFIEDNYDEALELIDQILEDNTHLRAKFGGDVASAGTGQQLYDVMAAILREAHDMGKGTLKAIEKIVNKFDDELDGAAMLQAFNVRGKLLNPSGMTVESARKLQASIMARLNPDEQRALLQAKEAFFDIIEPVMTQAHDIGLISNRTWKNLIQPNLRNYVPFAVLDYWDGKVGAGIHPQSGTAKNIADPILASELKAAAMFNWIQRQTQTQLLRQAYARGGVVIPVGKKLEGYGALDRERQKNAKDDISRFQLWVDGKPHLVEFPDDPGKQLERAAERPSFMQDLYRWQNSPVGKFSRGVLSLYTTLSPSFLIYSNAIRDTQTSAQRVGYVASAKQSIELKRAAELAHNYAQVAFGGVMLPEVEAMVMSGALPPPQFSRAFYQDADLLEQMIKNGGVTAMQAMGTRPDSIKLPGKLEAWYDRAEKLSAALEAIPKIQTYYASLKSGLTEEQSVALAKRAGIPNPGVGGLWSGFLEAFLPWTRVHVQGLRSTINVARDPKLNKHFFARVVTFEMVPRIARYTIASGIVAAALGRGDDDDSWLASLGEFFRRASPYKQGLDNLIPLGWRDPRTGKFHTLVSTFGMRASQIPAHWEAVSLRIPSSEEGKLWGSLLWGNLSGMSKNVARAGSNPLSNTADWALNMALPGVNPTFETVSQQYSLWFRGRNPKDSFRGTPVANQEMFDAGGGARAQANLGALINAGGDMGKAIAVVATGLGMNPRAFEWNARGGEHPAVLSRAPVTARMFSFDNYSRFRDERNAELDQQKYGARARMVIPDEARELYDYYNKNVGRQKYMDATEMQKFYVARAWKSYVWGNRKQPDRMYSRALSAVMPDGSKEARETVHEDLKRISEPYVLQFRSVK